MKNIDAHVSHKIEEELRQRLARALAARALDELQVELTPAQTPARYRRASQRGRRSRAKRSS